MATRSGANTFRKKKLDPMTFEPGYVVAVLPTYAVQRVFCMPEGNTSIQYVYRIGIPLNANTLSNGSHKFFTCSLKFPKKMSFLVKLA